MRDLLPKLLLLSAMVLWSTAASGQTREDVARARTIATQANESLAKGDYVAAIAGYRDAYAIVPEAPFLVAEAIALRKSGDCTGAVEVVAKWRGVAVNPSEQHAADMSRLAAICALQDAEEALASDDLVQAEAHASSAAAQDDSESTRGDVARVRDAIATRQRELAARDEKRPATDPERPTTAAVEHVDSPGPGGGATRILGWSLVGVGVGAATFAIAQQLTFNNRNDDYNAALEKAGCEDSGCGGSAGDYAEAERLRGELNGPKTGVIVGWSAAGILGAAGLTLLVLSPGRAELAWLPPAGASVQLRF